jgi:ArsR family transcriptional regulator
MNHLVSFAHALSDATRLRIVRLVTDEALCVCELADILQMPQSSVSSHIQVMRKAGLLASERCEKWVYYKLEGKFRSLMATLGKFFSVDTPSESILKSDAVRARLRLAKREESCCPGPKTLNSPGFGAERKTLKTNRIIK